MKNLFHKIKVHLLFAGLLVFSLVSFTGLSAFGEPEVKSYSAGNVNFSIGGGWEELAVSSPMRKFQFRIPKTAEDAEDGEMAVFYFGPGQGGSVESNIERWQSQFKPAGSLNERPSGRRRTSNPSLSARGSMDEPLSGGRQSGSPARQARDSAEVSSQISTKAVNGLKVTILSMEGSFQAAMAMQGSSVKSDYALLGAIVEGPQGPVFFKLYGPRKTVQNARASFDFLIESFKA